MAPAFLGCFRLSRLGVYFTATVSASQLKDKAVKFLNSSCPDKSRCMVPLSTPGLGPELISFLFGVHVMVLAK